MLVVGLFERVLEGGVCPTLAPWVRGVTLAVPVVLALAFVAYAALLAGRVVAHGWPEPEARLRLEAFRAYLDETERRDMAFLAPADMDLHWRLHQPRHGFPHGSHTGHIFLGWWKNVGSYPSFATPTDGTAYCHLLAEQGPPLYVGPIAEAGLACVEGEASAYRLDAVLPYGRNGRLPVYLRKDTPPSGGNS
ncbi:MAG: hypothetical protein H6922_02990 [Pseudomonadaceae bacterium]|nr:hypothetical protein [Pseudomonadaceae bacterium]